MSKSVAKWIALITEGIALPTLLVLSLVACSVPVLRDGEHQAPSVAPSPIMDEPMVYAYPMSDCEDLPGEPDGYGVPCVAWDEREWRMVRSFAPYWAEILPKCSAEDYPDVMPCVHQSRKDGRLTVMAGSAIFD